MSKCGSGLLRVPIESLPSRRRWVRSIERLGFSWRIRRVYNVPSTEAARAGNARERWRIPTEAPLVLYYEGRNGYDRDSRAFAQSLLSALGAGSRARGQSLAVLRHNPADVKVLLEMRNLAYTDHAWALRYEQMRQRDAEKVLKGLLDYAAGRRLQARR